MQDEALRDAIPDIFSVDYKGGAVQVTGGQNASDDEFLADNETLSETHNAQAVYPATLASFQRLQVNDVAEVFTGAFGYQCAEFLLTVFLFPAVEIHGFHVIVVQYLLKYIFVLRVAESRWVGANPVVSLCLRGQVWEFFRTRCAACSAA